VLERAALMVGQGPLTWIKHERLEPGQVDRERVGCHGREYGSPARAGLVDDLDRAARRREDIARSPVYTHMA
jgi:hypothetical protein